MKELKRFMRPQTSGVLLVSFFSIVPWCCILAVLFTNPDSLFSGNALTLLVLLLMLVGEPILFYCLVVCEYRTWIRDVKNYRTNGTFEALSAEFQNASPCFNRRRLRLGSSHIFCRGETRAVAYDDILAINVWHNQQNGKVTITAAVRDEKLPVSFRSVVWRQSDAETEEALSALSEHNPDIEIKHRSH